MWSWARTLEIPTDLDDALREAKAVRDVVVHRASRLEDKALAEAPTIASTFSIAVGDLIRVDRETSGTYSVPR